MRVALIVTDLTPPRMGGISKVATEIANRLPELGHEVDVFCLPRTTEVFPEKAGLRLVPVVPRLAFYTEYPVVSFSLSAFRALLREHETRHYDVSHAMNFNNYGLPFNRKKLRRAGIAHVSTAFETTDMEIRAKWREFLSCPRLHLFAQIAMECYLAPWQRAYIGWADAITTEDVETLESLIKYGVTPDRVRLIPSGVDIRHLGEEVPVHRVFSASPLILCPGRVDGRKGSQYALEAFALLAAKMPNAGLVFAGGGRGSHFVAVQQRARELGVEDRVLFTGSVPDLRPWYRSADLVVIPSLSEGIPITLQEAMAFSKPVVCSKLEGTFAWAKDFPSIRWSKPGDSASVASGMMTALSEVREDDLRQSREAILDYDWMKVTERYAKVYEEAASSLSR